MTTSTTDSQAAATLDERFQAAKASLDAIDQAHVLTYYDELDEGQKDELLKEIEGVDWPEVGRLIESHVLNKPEFELPAQIEPAPFYPSEPEQEQVADYVKAREIGEELIEEGSVAAFTVAGGQGTRLGWNGPKGTFPATPVRELPLFAVFAEYLIKLKRKYGKHVPWYVMTSPINDAATREFFERRDYFGLHKENVKIFPQAMMPAMDMTTGKVLLAGKSNIALSPNGHGGSLKALHTSGALADMKERGIKQISYIQIDNPSVKVIDPLFLGLHQMNDAEMSSKMLPKAYPKEKLGNFCLADGKMAVIEYSDLPDELAEQRLDDGELRFRAGSIAIHAITVDFVESLNTSAEGFGLEFHRAEKKVPYVDLATGEQVKPTEPNAVKLETFVFDALPMCENSIILETDRVAEFAPIKNADQVEDGKLVSVDCPGTSQQLQTERAARWLEAKGVSIPRNADGEVDAIIEIKQTTAIEPDDLDSAQLPEEIKSGDEVLI